MLFRSFLHLCEVVRHAVARAPLGTVPALAGRLVGLLQFGSYRERYQQLRRLMALGSAGGEEQRTIRIDDPQAAVGRSRAAKRDVTTRLRRSA